jgi:(p)ppGpp synthase/HD superfamily hydrolase
MISDVIDRAIGFAALSHAGQRRKRGEMPFIAHPFGVAAILLRMGCDDVIVAAGLLHDTVEDTTATLADIRGEFGDDVADLVAICSEPQGESWEIRKQTAISQYRAAPLAGKLVIAADKYHNLYHVQRNWHKAGVSTWDGFSRKAEQQAWYYRAVVASLLENNPNAEAYPIFAELASIVNSLFAGVRSQAPEETKVQV